MELINQERADFFKAEQDFKKKASQSASLSKYHNQRDKSFEDDDFGRSVIAAQAHNHDKSISTPSKMSVLKDLSDNLSQIEPPVDHAPESVKLVT